MAVKITIHRGTNQIGGSITEIATEKTHIFIDFGAELSPEKGKSTDDKMVEMMKEKVKNGNCDAILFTHYHGDHVGLLNRIPEIEESTRKEIANLRIGHTSREVMKTIHNRLKKVDDKNKTKEENEKQKKMHRDVLAILKDNERWLNKENGEEFEVEDGKVFKIGDFTITPVSTDHSAFDSYMYIIEAERKCIVHTGDFRTHGRKGENFFDENEGLPAVIKRLAHKPDVLLIEGTMLSRLKDGKKTSEVKSEVKLKEKAAELLEKHRHAFVACSSTNVDSLISFLEAAKEKKKKFKFYVNSYVYEQLENYNKAGLEFDMGIVERIYVSDKDIEDTVKKMKKDGFVMIINNPTYYHEFVKEFEEVQPILIYSMWGGYLEQNKPYTNDNLIEFVKLFKDNCHRLHTSGHAYKEDIEEMINKVSPAKAIIPIHTERKWDFENLKIGDLSKLVTPMSDGDTYIVFSDKEVNETGEYQCIADETAKLLEERKWELKKEKWEQPEHPEWEDRYKGYYDKIKNNEKYIKAVCNCFDTGNAIKYLSLGRVNNTSLRGNGKGNVFIDLRIAGVSVAELTVSPEKLNEDMKNGIVDETEVRETAKMQFKKRAIDKVEKYLPDGTEKEYRKITSEFFDVKQKKNSESEKESLPKTFDWKDKCFQEYRFEPYMKFLRDCNFKLDAEHPVETKLLDILNKHGWSDKLNLCKLCEQYYQLLTPIKASRISENILKYSGAKGGGIDILANINGERLCVIELKDSYKEEESPKKAIKQAIAYATFIIKLLRSENARGAEWYKYFLGETAELTDDPITVNAVIAMPYKNGCDELNGEDKAFEGVELKVWRGNTAEVPPDIIKLHYMYFEKDEQNEPHLKEFKTSLFE